jgi:GNAT superfamily N-acetyltransferase
MKNFTIRQWIKEDIEGLAVLFDEYRVFYRMDSDLVGAVRFLSERFSQSESVVFIAEDEGIMAGFVQLYPVFSSTRMQRLWLLNDLYVTVACRGKGISKALLEASADFNRISGACGLFLETEKTNLVANQLYRAKGWEQDDEHNYYFLRTK